MKKKSPASELMDINIDVSVDPPPSPTYVVYIYVRGMAGCFRYEVATREQVMDHFAAITTNGYRRQNDRGIFEWYAPSTIDRVRIVGPGLESAYRDEFMRT